MEIFSGYNIYVKLDNKSNIIAVNSNAFISNFSDWILIESNVPGDRGHHAQGNYFDKSIYTQDGIPRYKLVDGKAQERTEDEIAADRAAIPAPPPTAQEQLRADVDFLAAMANIEL